MSGGQLPIGVPGARCSYWLAKEALFIEPEASVLGPRREPAELSRLCDELRRSREREPIDGILLVLSIAEFVELDEQGLDAYANRIRAYLVEVGRALRADVPTYVVLSRYDTLWGFAEVFQWAAERGREEPWGFTLPLETSPDNAGPRILQELEGLNARPGVDLPRAGELGGRARGADAGVPAPGRGAGADAAAAAALRGDRDGERVRAGAVAPRGGDRQRDARHGGPAPRGGDAVHEHGAGAAAERGGRDAAGGLPIHATLRAVVLPERDIVPLRQRWRDDRFTLVCFVGGLLLLLAAGLTEIILRYAM